MAARNKARAGIKKKWKYIEITIRDGKSRSLAALSTKVSREYFNGKYDGLISWSRPLGKRHVFREHRDLQFGWYWADYDVIYIHQTLNHSRVPDFVVEYHIFHEMLHRKHKIYHKKGRHCFHTKQMEVEDGTFARLDEVNEWIAANRDWLYRF